MLSVETIAEQIFERIVREGSATFADLARDVPGFSGPYALTIGAPDSNIVVWPSVSKPTFEALQQLRDEGLITQDFADPSEYRRAAPDMPVAPQTDNGKVRSYPEPHWLPMRLFAVTDDEDSSPPTAPAITTKPPACVLGVL